jgi:hypothetical protein
MPVGSGTNAYVSTVVRNKALAHADIDVLSLAVQSRWHPLRVGKDVDADGMPPEGVSAASAAPFW